MYENRETSIRGIVITILLIILVICVLIWIFPTKNDLKKINGSDNSVLLSEIYRDNLFILQNAGKAYYYTATIPKNVGDATSVNLEKLISSKMLLELKDKNGKSCDNKKSYVQLIKRGTDDYQLKSYLKCDDFEDYIVTTLGCKDFRNGCKTTSTSKSTTKTTTKTTTTSTNNDTKVSYTTKYLYTCKGSTTYGSWSSWSRNYVSASSTREVQTRTVSENVYKVVKQEPIYGEAPMVEHIEHGVRSINGKPTGAIVSTCTKEERSATNIIWTCDVATMVPGERPIIGYRDVKDWVLENVTEYRYRDLKTSTYQYWSTSSKPNSGCTLTKTEKVANY